jgi:hypothetical protein
VKVREVTEHMTDVVEDTPMKETSVMAKAEATLVGSDRRVPGGMAPMEIMGESWQV